MGCTPSVSTGTAAPTTWSWTRSRSSTRATRASPATTSTPTGSAPLGSGRAGLTLSKPLALDYKPVTRVENYCASGSEAFRNACYAVASGAYDGVMAVGVEKLKDSGFSGLLRGDPPADGTAADLAHGACGILAAGSGILRPVRRRPRGDSEAMTHIAWKNHYNGARNPKAQFRSEVSKEKIESAPLVAGRLGSSTARVCPTAPPAR